MMQIIECECGETIIDSNGYCIKCKLYRRPDLDNILKRIYDITADLKKLNKHMKKSNK